MNNLIVTAVVRNIATAIVNALLARSLISTGDASAWNDTFVQLLFGLASLSMLAWTYMANRWPNLVKATAGLKQVQTVVVNTADASPHPILMDHNDITLK